MYLSTKSGRHQTSAMVLCGLFLSLSSVSITRADTIIEYLGTVNKGRTGNVFYSYGHRATGGSFGPQLGGYRQRPSGKTLFAVDPDPVFTFTRTDISSDGFNVGDKIHLNIIDLPITKRNDLNVQIGQMDLKGTLTVGSDAGGGVFAFGGSLDYEIEFTASAPDGIYAGNWLTGTFYFQDLIIMSGFNSIKFDGVDSPELKMSLWGDNRPSAGVIDGKRWRSYDPVTKTGVVKKDPYSFGLDLSISADPTGETIIPAPAAVWAGMTGFGLLVLNYFGRWRRRLSVQGATA